MATIGGQLSTPESGWRRYDDSDSRIKYNGSGWGDSTSFTGRTGAFTKYNSTTSDSTTINFKFYGSKLRLYGAGYSGMNSGNIVIIDGKSYDMALWSSLINNAICISFSIDSLQLGIHDVKIIHNFSARIYLDAIDIDNTGYLMHPILNQVSDINTMEEGDCIPCRYTAIKSGQAGYFSELGTCTADEIPIAGTATPDGLFYFIKTDKGTLVADRVLQTSISWDALNNAKFIEGISFNYTDVTHQSYLIESSHYSTRNLAFNNTVGPYASTCWESATADGKGWVGQHFPVPMIIKGYSLNASTNFAYGPKTWTFEGSSDGINWTVLHTVTSENTWANGLKRYYQFINTNSYSYYRINVTDSYNTSGYLIIGEIEMFLTSQQNDTRSIIRSMSGGVAYLNTDGNQSTTDKSLGAWPPNNEWDKYIVNSDLTGKITKGDNSIWNWYSIREWIRETPILSYASNTTRMVRGLSISNAQYAPSSTVSANYGFRPVLNYVESDIASEVIY